MPSIRQLSLLALAGLGAAIPLQVREEVPSAHAIVDVADDVVNLVKDAYNHIQDIDERHRQAEANFTQSVVGTLAARYPNKNVIIYSNAASVTKFKDGVYHHYDFDLGQGKKQGYEAWVFESGSIKRAGPGGYNNWCFNGNWNRKDDHVDFAKISTANHGNQQPAHGNQHGANSTVPALNFDFKPKHNSTNGRNTSFVPLHHPVTFKPAPPPQKPLLPPTHPAPRNGPGSDGHYFVQCKSSVSGSVSQGVAYYKELLPGGHVGKKPDDFTWLSQLHGLLPYDLKYRKHGHDSNTTNTGKGDHAHDSTAHPRDVTIPHHNGLNITGNPSHGHKVTEQRGRGNNSTASSHVDWTLPVGAVEFESMQSSIHWQIFGNAIAETVEIDETCGVADNGREHFWVYKARSETLFEMEDFACDSLYYAF